MRYLVTGGAGFIGSNIVDELVRRGHEVTVLDDLSTGAEINLADARAKVDFRVGSIADLAAVQSACHKMDYVIHLAARTSVPKSVIDPIETNRVNIDGTLNVLVAARDAKVRRMVYAASSSAYGETPTLPKIETMPAEPISPYGVTKYVGELYAQVFGRVYGLENASVRYFNVFGPRQDPTSQYSGVLSRFMLAAIEGAPLTIYGDGEQTRDFICVSDVVTANLRALEAERGIGEAFNIGIGQPTSIKELYGILAELFNNPDIAPVYTDERRGDIKHSYANVTKAKNVLGFQAKIELKPGVDHLIRAYCAPSR